ncbi:MAG: ABC transporter substrate-binding protein [Chloroflexota bacterium]
MNKLKLVIFFVLIFGVGIGACSQEAEPEPTALLKLRVPMGYFANVQYAPFYVAVEKGYFAEAGIEIEFDYSFETDGVALVGAGELPFAVVSGEQVLLARAQEIPVVYVAAWFQEYPIAVMAMDGAAINSPDTLAGRNIGVPGLFGASYIGLRALLDYSDIELGDVTLESIGFNQVESLATDQVEAVVGYVNNEPVQLAAQGYDVDVIRVADYVHLAANGIITSEQTIVDNPDLVSSLVAAFLKGLADSIADPDEAYEISKIYVESLANANEDEEAIQREVLRLSIELWLAEVLGFANSESWENMQEVLIGMELLLEPLDLDAAYTNDFLP